MQTIRSIRLAVVVLVPLLLLLMYSPAQAAAAAEEQTSGEAQAGKAAPGLKASPETLLQADVDQLKSHIAELEALSNPDTDSKVALELYQKALSQLQMAERDRVAIDGYRKLIAEAGEKKAQLQARLEQLQKQTAQVPPAGEELDFKALEQQLDKAQSERRLLQSKLLDLQASITGERRRPDELIDELTQAKLKLDNVESELQSKGQGEGGGIVDQARRALLETTRAAVKNQVRRLEMERLGHVPGIDLMMLQEQLLQAQLAQATARVTQLQEVLNSRRVSAAAAAAKQAVEVKQGSSGKLPLVQAEAARNAELGAILRKVAAELTQAARQKELQANRLLLLGRNMERARQQLDIAEFDEPLGEVLRTQRKELPNLRELEKRMAKTRHKAAAVRLQQFRLEDQLQSLLSGAYKNDLLQKAKARGMSIWERSQLQKEVEKLLQDRGELLQQLRDTEGRYEKVLGDLELEQQQLISKVKQYSDLLDRNLFWLPSAPLADRDILKNALKGLKGLAAQDWLDVATGLARGVLQYPLRGVGLLLAVLLLLLLRRRMRRGLVQMAPRVGNVARDHFTLTLKALLITLLLAGPWPLLLAGTAWLMAAGSGVAGDIVAESLLPVSAVVLLLQVSRYLFIPNGLAEVHFQWHRYTIQVLRRNLRWAQPAVTPMVFLVGLTEGLGDAFFRDNLGRVTSILLVLLLALFAHRVLNSRTGVLKHARGFRVYWYHLALGTCLFLIVLSLLGYYYTELRFLRIDYQSAWVIFAAVLLYHIIHRWLLVAERRLALSRARAKRQALAESRAAKQAAEAAGEGLVELPELEEIELEEVNEQTRRLLKVGVVLFTVAGLITIWSQLTPAFGRLEDMVLWEHLVSQGDKQVTAPVTLWNLLAALLVMVLTVVAGANLPGLLEIALLEPLALNPGSRYAVTRITLYLIYVAGFLVTVNLLGLAWGDVQWLVAAMSVGIGFGLQEIFANFISGIMILFERPIRIGDTVTVGDVSGTVSRIRIRATTITDWDHKELVVPNKSFVTDPLINWTLSDPITRVVIDIGIAYGSDTGKAHQIMTDVVNAHPEVLQEPKPSVFFIAFGESSLDFQIRVFVSERIKRMPLIHDIHMELDWALGEVGIEIPFPQRDLHLRSVDPDVVFRRQGTGDRGQNTEK